MTRRTRSLLAGLLAAVLLAPAAPAHAFWIGVGSGAGLATATTMPAGQQPAGTVTGQSVTIAWPQSSLRGTALGGYSGGGYTVRRYASGSSLALTPNASCATVIGGAGATLQCVEAGVPYGGWQYAVTPVLNSFTGEPGPKSAPVSVTTAASVLTAVSAQNPTTSQTTGDIRLTWTAAAGATGYNVYRRAAGGSFDFTTALNGATPLAAGTTYTDPGSGLAAGTTYHYAVRAVAGSPAVESASSNVLSAATISRPAAPASITATAAAGARVDLVWASVSGATGYNVYRRTSNGSFNYAAPLNGATLLAGTAYTDVTAANGTSYRYVVRAVVVGAGGVRLQSASSVQSAAVVADGTAPTPPTTANVTNGHVLASARCNIAAGTRFVNHASRAAVTVAATLGSPEPGATVIFSATTPTSTPVIGSAVAAASTTATLDLTSLADGVVTLNAYSRDAAGNLSAARAMTAAVRKDVVFAPPLTIRFDGGFLGFGATISGDAECGADIVATKGSNVKYATVEPGQSTYEISVSAFGSSSGWSATATDPAGNPAAPAED